ncbi:MAG: SRPBCC domain-containing protein [Luteolibacter sp.]
MSTPPIVKVVRRYQASAEKVFDAWLDPAMLARWMFGPDVRDEEIVRLTLEAWVGGRFSFVVKRGDQEIDHVGQYLEMERPERLKFTWGIAGVSVDESWVTLEIVADGDACELTLTHELDPAWSDYADRTKQGWTMMCGKLAEVLEA